MSDFMFYFIFMLSQGKHILCFWIKYYLCFYRTHDLFWNLSLRKCVTLKNSKKNPFIYARNVCTCACLWLAAFRGRSRSHLHPVSLRQSVCACVCVCVCMSVTHLAGLLYLSANKQQCHKPSGHKLDKEERPKKKKKDPKFSNRGDEIRSVIIKFLPCQ